MSQPDETTPHVLIVDDDTRIRELLQKYLSDNGYRTSTAADAAEAQTKMDGLEYDLLVLDIMMPGITGLEFTEKLRAAENPVPILLLTALTRRNCYCASKAFCAAVPAMSRRLRRPKKCILETIYFAMSAAN